MSKPGKTGLRRIWNAMFYSLQGITAAWQHEAAFRQEAALCIIMIPLAFLVGDTAVERALLAGTCLLVLVTELLNSAIEAIVDRIRALRELTDRVGFVATAVGVRRSTDGGQSYQSATSGLTDTGSGNAPFITKIGKSVADGRSYCDNCGKTLEARDLVPIRHDNVLDALAVRACRRIPAGFEDFVHVLLTDRFRDVVVHTG